MSKYEDKRAHRVASWVAAVALIVPLAACEDELTVTEREFLTPAGVSVDLLVAGAIRDFALAYSGGGLTDRILSVGGVTSDELFSSGTFSTRTASDQRDHFDMSSGNTGDFGYVELHQARRASLRAFDALGEAGQGSSSDASDMKMFEGFTYVALAENYCSGIPFSDVTAEGELVDGPPLSTSQVFEASLPIFDAAISIDGSNDAARVGKGRALVSLGRYSEAATAVAGVPSGFVRLIEHSDNSGGQENPIFNLQSNGRYSVSDVEGGTGLPFRSAMDPRVPWTEDPEGGFDSSIRLFLFDPYASNRSAPVTFASGVEARLIEAEAQMNAGDGAGMIATLNALRADVFNLMSARYPNYGDLVGGTTGFPTTLAPLTDPGAGAAREDLLFSERGFWLFLTSHRLGDLRRLIRDYGRSESQVFPTGPYFKGGSYGQDVNMPLEFDETNNSLYDESMCVFTAP